MMLVPYGKHAGKPISSMTDGWLQQVAHAPTDDLVFRQAVHSELAKRILKKSTKKKAKRTRNGVPPWKRKQAYDRAKKDNEGFVVVPRGPDSGRRVSSMSPAQIRKGAELAMTKQELNALLLSKEYEAHAKQKRQGKPGNKLASA